MQLQNSTAHNLNTWMLVIQLVDVVFIAINMFPFAEPPALILLFALPSILLRLYPSLRKNLYFEVPAIVISLVAVFMCIANIVLLMKIQDPLGRAMFGGLLVFLALPSGILGASFLWVLLGDQEEVKLHPMVYYQDIGDLNGKQVSGGIRGWNQFNMAMV